MNTLISLLFMQKLTGNSKKFKRNFKKKNAPSILILKNLGLMVYCVFEFIFTTIYSLIAPKKVIQEVEVKSKNVVSFQKYKNEKTKANETVFNLQIPNKLS